MTCDVSNATAWQTDHARELHDDAGEEHARRRLRLGECIRAASEPAAGSLDEDGDRIGDDEDDREQTRADAGSIRAELADDEDEEAIARCREECRADCDVSLSVAATDGLESEITFMRKLVCARSL